MITYQPVNNHDDLLKVVDGLLEEAGLDRKELGGKMTFAGMDPIRPTGLKVGCAAAAITGANAVASSLIWKMRSGESQDIHIDLRKAYVHHQRLAGYAREVHVDQRHTAYGGRDRWRGRWRGGNPYPPHQGWAVRRLDVALRCEHGKGHEIAQQRHAASTSSSKPHGNGMPRIWRKRLKTRRSRSSCAAPERNTRPRNSINIT